MTVITRYNKGTEKSSFNVVFSFAILQGDLCLEETFSTERRYVYIIVSLPVLDYPVKEKKKSYL